MQRSRKVLEPPHAARPLSQWLHVGLKPGGFDAILLETRHVKRRCLAMTVKTDRNDARGLAQLMRMVGPEPLK
jgi:transposase